MSQYYFTVAALPYIDFESAPALTYRDFLALCESTLDARDYEFLLSAKLDGSLPEHCTNGVLKAWSVFEQSLRNELVKLRAPQLGIETEKYLKLFVDSTVTPLIARNSVKEENPEKAEAYLDRERWLFLDEIESGHYFDIEKLIVYSLRLQILERRKLFTPERGKEGFNGLYEQIKTAIKDA